jgi:hypothetical protein
MLSTFAGRVSIKKGDVARRGNNAGACSLLLLAGLLLKKGDVARRGRSRGACSVLVLAGFPLKRGMLPGGAITQVHVLYFCSQGFH